MIEAAFFSLASADVDRLSSYAGIPEDAYVDLWRCPSVESLRELAVLLGCDPSAAFIPVFTSPESGTMILRAGAEFERVLQDQTTDELLHAGTALATVPSWAEMQMNPMDLAGAVLSLGAQWDVACERGYPLWVWVDSPV